MNTRSSFYRIDRPTGPLRKQQDTQCASTADVRVSSVTTEDAFATLGAAWDDLAARTKPAAVFNRYDWFAAAWKWRRRDAQLRILVAHDANRVIAILPLIATHGARRERLWTFLAVPDTQRCDLIAPEDAVDIASYALAKEIAARREWDVLMLDYLDRDGSIPDRLAPHLRRWGANVVIQDRVSNPSIPLVGTWSAYWTSRSRSLKKACNLAANRLEKAGNVRVARVGPGAITDFDYDQALAAAIEVSSRSWKRGTDNSLDQGAPGDFIRSLSQSARRHGWLSVWLAYLDDRPVAMEYQLVHDGNVHALRADFDAEFERISPGSFLFRHLLEHLFETGDSLYLMGPGENAYKTRWATDAHPLRRVWCYNRTTAGRIAYWTDQRVKPLLRAMRDRARRRVAEM
jgi:CelD/BcsL family acetyltransferase involved in cellulose biosynthesis